MFLQAEKNNLFNKGVKELGCVFRVNPDRMIKDLINDRKSVGSRIRYHGSQITYHESRYIKENDETLHGIDSLIPVIDPSAGDLALLISDPDSSQSKELHLN